MPTLKMGDAGYDAVLLAFKKAQGSPSAAVPSKITVFGKVYSWYEDTDAAPIEHPNGTTSQPVKFVEEGAATFLGGGYEDTSTGPRSAPASLLPPTSPQMSQAQVMAERTAEKKLSESAKDKGGNKTANADKHTASTKEVPKTDDSNSPKSSE